MNLQTFLQTVSERAREAEEAQKVGGDGRFLRVTGIVELSDRDYIVTASGQWLRRSPLKPWANKAERKALRRQRTQEHLCQTKPTNS